MSSAPSSALWYAFDPIWYRQTYAPLHEDIAPLSDPELEDWYAAHGAPSGHSPNRYFNEEWYRLTCTSAMAGLADGTYRSGFHHYCTAGLHDCSPHMLFNERFYRSHHADLTDANLATGGYVNGYDHYLRAGDSEHRTGHPFFSPTLYLSNRPEEDPALSHLPPFHHLLHMPADLPDRIRLSRHFDPIWYQAMRPDMAHMVQCGLAPNVLQQFLSTFTAGRF